MKYEICHGLTPAGTTQPVTHSLPPSGMGERTGRIKVRKLSWEAGLYHA